MDKERPTWGFGSAGLGVLSLDCGSIRMALFPTFKSWKQERKAKKQNARIQQKGA